jgi:hypothetical protein
MRGGKKKRVNFLEGLFTQSSEWKFEQF